MRLSRKGDQMPKTAKGWVMFIATVAVAMAVIARIPQVKRIVMG